MGLVRSTNLLRLSLQKPAHANMGGAAYSKSGWRDKLLAYGATRKAIQSMPMLVAIFFMRLCEVLFFAGIAGSSVVVVISFIEDIQELVGD